MVLVVNGKVSMMEKTVSYKTSAFLYSLPTPFWTMKPRLLVWQHMFLFYVTSANIV